MKKMTLFVFVLFVSFAAFAKEEPAVQPVGVGPVQGEAALTTLPFEFSLGRGEWIQSRTGEIFTSGTHAPDFLLPSLREAPAPIRYPRWAVQEEWQGTFQIAIEILPTGEVGRWKVTQSTGYPLLDEAATAAVRKWKFHPATENGSAIVSCIQVPIRFELET